MLKQLVSRIKELSAEQFDAEQRLKQLQDLNQQQAEYDCSFALLTGGRGQLRSGLGCCQGAVGGADHPSGADQEP